MRRTKKPAPFTLALAWKLRQQIHCAFSCSSRTFANRSKPPNGRKLKREGYASSSKERWRIHQSPAIALVHGASGDQKGISLSSMRSSALTVSFALRFEPFLPDLLDPFGAAF